MSTEHKRRWRGGLLAVVCLASGLMHVPYASASWSAPETVAALNISGGLSSGSVVVAENAKGDSTIAWSQPASRSSRREDAWVLTRRGGGAWSKPTRLSAPQISVSAVGAVVSATGETTVTWSERSALHGRKRTEVLVRSLRANHWGPEHVLAAAEEASREAAVTTPQPRIALSPNGVPVVLFSIGRRASAEAVEVDRRSRDGRWPRPRVVAHTAYCGEASVATDPAGELLLAWTHGNPISPGSLTRVEAVTLSRNLRAQSSPVALSPTGRYAYAPMIAVDARGDATLIWALEGHESQPHSAPLEAAARTAGHRFTLRAGGRVIAGDGSPGGVAVDSRGEATAVFSAGQAEVASRPLAGQWGAPTPLSPAPATKLVLAQDASEDLLAAWTTVLPEVQGQPPRRSAIQASMRRAGGAWQTPTVISPPDSRNAAVSIGASNRALAAWENETTHRLETADFSP